jgi:hypothetical protein
MTAMKAMVVGEMGDTEVIEIPPDGFEQAFKEHCQADIFEHLDLAEDLDMWMDEEGRLKADQVVNYAMTDLRDHFWEQNGITIPADWPPLVGKALLTGGGDGEGDTRPLTDDLISQLERWFANWRAS